VLEVCPPREAAGAIDRGAWYQRALLEQGRREVAAASSPDDALAQLLSFHTDFALTSSDLIRVQDRDLANLSSGEARRVRRLQRAYVELW